MALNRMLLTRMEWSAEFIEKAEYLFSDKAKEANVLMASAVGFDSVPADMGALFTVRWLFSSGLSLQSPITIMPWRMLPFYHLTACLLMSLARIRWISFSIRAYLPRLTRFSASRLGRLGLGGTTPRGKPLLLPSSPTPPSPAHC